MFRALCKHLTPSTLIAFVALVFAITGGAFAASGQGGSSPGKASASTTIATVAKSKPKAKAGPRGPAGPAGKTGASGAQGPAGAQGAQGPAGAAGAKGETGAAGPQGLVGPAGKDGENGKNGTTGFTKTLPGGETETGVWSVHPAEGEEPFAPISFSIPLAHELEQASVHIAPDAECPGTAEAPEANPGNLCVYVGENYSNDVELHAIFKPFGLEKGGAGTSGAMLYVTGLHAPALAWGTWAVTAAE